MDSLAVAGLVGGDPTSVRQGTDRIQCYDLIDALIDPPAHIELIQMDAILPLILRLFSVGRTGILRQHLGDEAAQLRITRLRVPDAGSGLLRNLDPHLGRWLGGEPAAGLRMAVCIGDIGFDIEDGGAIDQIDAGQLQPQAGALLVDAEQLHDR